MKLNVNVYSTNWGNRFVSRSLSNQQGVDGFAQFKDIDVTHKGLEIEGTYKLANATTTLKGMLSLGDWTYDKNFSAELFDENNNHLVRVPYTLKGLR